MHSSQIHNGQRLRIRIRQQVTLPPHHAYENPIPGASINELAMKAPRLEQVHQPTPHQVMHVQTVTSCPPLGACPPPPPTHAAALPPQLGAAPPPPPSLPTFAAPPENRTQQFHFETPPAPHTAPLDSRPRFDDGTPSLKSSVKEDIPRATAKFTVDDAIDLPLDPRRIDHKAKARFGFLSVNKQQNETNFSELPREVQKVLFRGLFLILAGATGLVRPVKHVEVGVISIVKKRLRSLRKENSIPSNFVMKPESLLKEAWLRGLIVFNPRSANDGSATSSSSSKKKSKQSRNNELMIPPQYYKGLREAIDLQPLNEEMKLIAALEVHSKLKVVGGQQKKQPCGYSADGTTFVVPLRDVQNELANRGDILAHEIFKLSSNQGPSLLEFDHDTTKTLGKAMCALLRVARDRKPESVAALVDHMMDDVVTGSFKQLSSNAMWSAIAKWAKSRGLLANFGRLSSWTASDFEETVKEPTTLDLRVAREHSLRYVRSLLSSFQCLAPAFTTPGGEGVVRGMVNEESLFAALVEQDRGPTYAWCLVRLAKLGLIELRRNGSKVDVPQQALVKHHHESETTIHATETLRESVVCSTCLYDLLAVQPLMNTPKAHFNLSLAAPLPSVDQYHVSVKRMISAGVVVSGAIATSTKKVKQQGAIGKPMDEAAVIREIQWALTLHSGFQLQPRADVQEVLSVFRFVQESALVTWDASLSGFVVTPGLFDTMYYSFLRRLQPCLTNAKETRHDAMTETQKQKKCPKLKNLFPIVLEKMNEWTSSSGPTIEFGVLASSGFMERALEDGVVSFTRNKKNEARIIELHVEQLHAMQDKLAYRSEVEAVMRDTEHPCLLVPCGVNPPRKLDNTLLLSLREEATQAAKQRVQDDGGEEDERSSNDGSGSEADKSGDDDDI